MDNATMSTGRPRASRVKITRADGSVSYQPPLGKRGSVAQRLQREVFARDGLRCRYCGYAPRSAKTLQIDHVVPVCRGGADDLTNLVVACGRCNQAKGTDTWEVVERPRWAEWRAAGVLQRGPKHRKS